MYKIKKTKQKKNAEVRKCVSPKNNCIISQYLIDLCFIENNESTSNALVRLKKSTFEASLKQLTHSFP